MADADDLLPPPGEPRAGTLVREDATPPFWRRLSIIWVVPLLALIVAGGVAWQAWRDRGVVIEITFTDATGIAPGQTQLRFREVQVGTVETMTFTDDLTSVVAHVRVDRKIAPYIDENAQFWIVRPEVSAQGISRLDTVFSGVFIEGYWTADGGAPRTRFTALDAPPLSIQRVAGMLVQLRMDSAGGIAPGAPVLYRGIRVGSIQALRLGSEGTGVVADAYIEAPNDRLLTTASVFWNRSGFSVSVGPQGLSLDVGSLAALVQGGVEFTTPVSGGRTVEPGQVFSLYDSEQDARDSQLAVGQGTPVEVAVLLEGSVSGLTQGAAVNYQALPVGRVESLSVVLETDTDGTETALQRAVVSLFPVKMGLAATASRDEVLDFLGREVEDGLRARAASSGLFGTSVVIELANIEDAEPAVLERDATPFPILPSAPSTAGDVAMTAEGLFARLASLPIESVIDAATRFLNSATELVASPELRSAPAAVQELLSDARELLGSEAVQTTPVRVQEVLEELRGLAQGLRESGIDDKLAQALESATTAASSIDTATKGLPELVASLRQVASEAATIRFQELGDRASALMGEIEGLAGTQGFRALPAQLGATLDELAQLLATLREGGATEALNATMGAAQTAAEGLARVSADLPALTARIDTVVQRLDGLIATYGERSTFSAETLATLRELRRTAASVGSFVQTLERNPSALLTGR